MFHIVAREPIIDADFQTIRFPGAVLSALDVSELHLNQGIDTIAVWYGMRPAELRIDSAAGYEFTMEVHACDPEGREDGVLMRLEFSL